MSRAAAIALLLAPAVGMGVLYLDLLRHVAWVVAVYAALLGG